MLLRYAGIGSRETPLPYLLIFKGIAKLLAEKGYTLTSGHAPGADCAFERGCDLADGLKEIFIPSKGFNGCFDGITEILPEAFVIAERFHPNWKACKEYPRKLMARNSHQVLGRDLNTKVDFIICYTDRGLGKGGTGQALRIAEYYNIPIFDAGRYSDIKECQKKLLEFLIKEGKVA